MVNLKKQKTYNGCLRFTSQRKFKFLKLDYVFSMKIGDMYWLKFYFKEKRMGFFNRDGHIYVKSKRFHLLLTISYGISILRSF